VAKTPGRTRAAQEVVLMYIEFRLPQGAGGMTAQYTNSALNRNLHEWSDRYGIAYNKKIHKHTVRVTFLENKQYEFFALTWNPKAENFLSYLTNYRFVEPMKHV
jgi:hypothetical protein